jgi:hypothetical protein
MQISLGQGDVHIKLTEGTAFIDLSETAVLLNDYVIDFPGEYERNLIFVEVREFQDSLIYILTIEGKTLIYLPTTTTVESLETLRDINNKDMVIFPANESLWKTLETWELSVAVPYGPKTQEFLTKLGQPVEMSQNVTLKPVDFEAEKTRFITLG